MLDCLKTLFWKLLALFRREPDTPPEPTTYKSPPTIADIYAAGMVPPPDFAPSAGPRAKWVKPKGLEKLTRSKQPPVAQTSKPPRPPRPRIKPDDNPEKWGRYYFRDAILDQLDRYFTYLHRMRVNDRDAYELHRQVGIQIMPQSAVEQFDKWRSANEMQELSAWWLATRPAFGAIAYGLDAGGDGLNRTGCIDVSPETFAKIEKPEHYKNVADLPKHRIVFVSGGKTIDIPGDEGRAKLGLLWTPRFLYFHKYTRPPASIQQVSDGDVYLLTIYWDRLTGFSKTYMKRHKGGSPQEYALCVDRETKKIRVLKRRVDEPLTIRSYNGNKYQIPNKRWGFGDAFLHMTSGRYDCSPEDFIIRIFIEAALAYETAAVGSLIRVEAHKKNLTATFGVEIKRTAYFFKDRDITLSESGRREPIFHIVRPHMRKTKTGERAVKMHFRGLRDFTWAGYKISISVPGRDHMVMPELNTGFINSTRVNSGRGMQSMKQFGQLLADNVKEGVGGWKTNAQKQ